MENKIIRLIRMSLVCSCLSLAGCSVPGTYFSTAGASRGVSNGKETYHPVIVPINQKLFRQTAAFSRTHPDNSLWYAPDYAYKVGPGDVLNVIVWDHPELSTPMSMTGAATQVAGIGQSRTGSNNSFSTNSSGILVNASGNIYFPYAGKIHVGGMTVEQLRTMLTKRIRRYIRRPQISVRVTGFRSQLVYVIGAVNTPGSTPVTDRPLTILDAIANSGGITPTTADTSHIFVVRGSGMHPQLFLLNAKSPGNLLLAERFKLYPKDIVYVPTAGISNWNRFLSEILPTVQTAAYADTLLKK